MVNTQRGPTSSLLARKARPLVALVLFDLWWMPSSGWCVSGWCVSGQPIKREEREPAPKTKPRPPTEEGWKGNQGRGRRDGGGVTTAGPTQKICGNIHSHCLTNHSENLCSY